MQRFWLFLTFMSFYLVPLFAQVYATQNHALRNGYKMDKVFIFFLGHNNAGDLTQDANKGLSLIEYDLFGHPRRIQFYNGNVTEYVYAATGEKLRTKHATAVSGLSVPLGQTQELTDSHIA